MSKEVSTALDMPLPDDPLRRDLIRVFSYVRDLAVLRSRVDRDLNSYEHRFWLENLRDHPECSSPCFDRNAERDGGEPWLRAGKRPEPKCPTASRELALWIEAKTGTRPDVPPRLLDRITQPSEPGLPVHIELIEDHPEVAEAFGDFVRTQWEPWRQRYDAWRWYQKNVYEPLFAIHRGLLRLGEEYELVMGLGCLVFAPHEGSLARRHVITAQATLEFDASSGVFTLLPGADGAKLAIETDMLEAKHRPDERVLEQVRAALEEAAGDPWDAEPIDRALRSFVQKMDADGSYDADRLRPHDPSPVPRIALAPALLLRRRTARGAVRAFECVIERLKAGEEIPASAERLVRTSDRRAHGIDGERDAVRLVGDLPARVYFPLAASEEQRTIVERLALGDGVLVQGPPGTGKSHTIANLMCHLLATGQRVLITAQTPRALQVLRDKLPQDIRPLCLSILGNDKAAQDNVEDSVRRITDKTAGATIAQLESEIDRAEKKIDEMLDRLALLEREMRQFRESETDEHTVADGAYRGTAQAIGESLRRQREDYGWFTDTVDPDAPMTVAAGDIAVWLHARRTLGPGREADLRRPRPVAGRDLPKGDRLIQQIDEWHRLRERVRPLADGEVHLSTLPAEDLRQAARVLRELQQAVHAVSAVAPAWAVVAIDDVLRGSGAAWMLLLSQTEAAVASLEPVAAELDARDVRLADQRREDMLLADVKDLHEHLLRGGGLGFLVFRPAVVRRTLAVARQTMVDGRPCDRMETLAVARQYLETSAALRRTWQLWEGKAAADGRSLSQQVAQLQALCDTLDRVVALGPSAQQAASALARLNLPESVLLQDMRAVDALAARCERVLDRNDFASLAQTLDARQRAVLELAGQPQAHEVCGLLAEALAARDQRQVTRCLEQIGELEADAAMLEAWQTLDERVRDVLPGCAALLHETWMDPVWDERVLRWSAAWAWARADAWLSRVSDADRAVVVERDILRSREAVKEWTIKASASRAWKNCLESLSPGHRQHLEAWQKAVKSLGKGTGKHAARWRRTAQEHLEQCREAIPAWVMPLYRVFDGITPRAGLFDVVIVDEASQCGPEALLLFYLAKKIIIVGDDKQISPSNVGLNQEDALQLLRQHLGDLALWDTFDVSRSLFDHGKVRLASNVLLREHFRCVPEIIRFSSDLCYSPPLIPLRPSPPHRLAPLVPRLIRAGRREGGPTSAINKAEAAAIVEAIAACCADGKYKDKTMGVISLLGEHQARLIERLLVERIGAEEVERRHLVCGDAYSFQGDERHVVFLSMVVSVRGDGSRGFSALTKSSDEQRFNVAASRAQDQLWLFHSVMPEDIANPSCMRHRLLTHFYDPARHAAEGVGINLGVLRKQVHDPQRASDAPTPFDSWFEAEVYLMIADRGYRVLPQYPAGSKRIDLVVEGQTRLAVECDGDRFHTDENLDEDMSRQRQLERAGWTFWRVRGSAFARNPHEALVPLWQTLSDLGINPEPVIDGTASRAGYIPAVPEVATIDMEAGESAADEDDISCYPD